MGRVTFYLLWAASFTFFLVSLILAILTGIYANKYHRLLEIPQEVYSGLFYTINTTWDSHRINHDPVNVSLKYSPNDLAILISIEAPFYNNPKAPDSPAGVLKDIEKYERVGVFIANDERKYIEVELGPQNHYLCVLLDGIKKPFNSGSQLQMSVWNQIDGQRWKSQALLPLAYLPANISTLNAYHTFNNGSLMLYEAMSPVPPNDFPEPDYHRLKYFMPLNVTFLLPSSIDITHPYRDLRYDDLWADHD